MKPRVCPQCGSAKIAPIMYGLPAFTPKLEADLAAGKIVLGGCCVTDNDPRWRCLECKAGILENGTVRRPEEDPLATI